MNRNPFRNMSQTVQELLLGVLFFSVVIEAVFLWFVSDKWYFSVGLWIGAALAAFMTIHMNHSIERTLELPESDAQGHMQKMVILRMGIVVLVFFAVCYFKLGSGVSMLAGMLTLKFSAYFQPVMHRLIEKTRKGR